MITTTFTALRKAQACKEGYGTLAKHLGGVHEYGANTPIPVATIIDSNGMDDTLWTLSYACGEGGQKIAHSFACDCAERVLHIYEAHVPGDSRPRKAIETKRAWLRGEATDDELAAARDAVNFLADALQRINGMAETDRGAMKARNIARASLRDPRVTAITGEVG